MDFFSRQDLARRNSRMLVILMILAVVCLGGVLCLALAGGLLAAGERDALSDPWAMFGLVMLGTIVVVALGSLWKSWEIGSQGGRGIAESLGGRRIVDGARDESERRLLNIVEEMSIASGVPMPAVYVLDGEQGINAFAAGWKPADAAVAVTRGALDRLDRDELQGVIGHEFSHILNGDMGLNLRLIGVVHGILLIALLGRLAMRSLGHMRSSDSKKGNQLLIVILVVGVALMVVGSVGWLFGQIIKAAVSRQREFLADASSVQFTRNPDGLARALASIGRLGSGGTRVAAPQAEQSSHLFFGEALSPLVAFLATHPPIEDRLRALRAMGATVSATGPAQAPAMPQASSQLVSGLAAAGARQPLTGATIAARAGTVDPDDLARSRGVLASLPTTLRTAAGDALGAQALVLALILDPRPAHAAQQIDLLERTAPGLVPEVRRMQAAAAGAKDRAMALLALAVPALADLQPPARRHFLRTAWDLARQDGVVSMHEYCMVRSLAHHLSPRRPAGTTPLQPVMGEAAIVLSSLARVGGEQQAPRALAAAAHVLLGAGGNLVLAPGIDHERLDRAFDRLHAASPAARSRLVQAAAACVAADGTASVAEIELLRLVATCLDVPIPALAA